MSSGSSSHGAVPGHGDSGEAQPRAASPAAPTAQPLPQYVGRRRRLLPGDPLFEYADLERQLGLQDAVVQVSASSHDSCGSEPTALPPLDFGAAA
jgi:hypothetical protein